MTKKQLLILLALFLLIAAGLGGWLMFGNQDAPVSNANAGFEISPLDHTMGNPKAKVVLIEYGALTCPNCARFNDEIFPQVKKNYIDTGKAFYIYRLYARLPEDVPAEKLALCTKDKYFEAVDLLYRNQPLWDPENGITDTHGGLLRVGRMAGLSPEQVDGCINDASAEAHIDQVKAESQSRYDLPGVPFFLLNGVALDWRGGYPEFAALLDKAPARP